MDSCLDEDDPEALSGLIPVTPPQKTQKPAVGEMSHHQTRNHSLDDLPRNSESLVFDASDDELCPYPSSIDMEDSMDDYVIVTSPQVHANIGEKKFKPLAEFIAAGGNADVFKVPSRAAVHPGRPPCVEIRPHPVRETQSQRFLRNIVCTGKQLWAGLENGVRFWELENVYEVGCRVTGKVRVGDEDTAPFHESLKTPPTTCLMVDYGTRLVWSGHEDGKIRSWKMDKPADDSNPLKHGLSWQAHRGPVNSIVMSCYGDMWSCSEGGIIKMWTWESIEKYLSCKSEEKYMATQLLETSGVDLRSHATINGICSISSSDVKCLFVDKARAKVWAVQPQTFSLWDARTKDLLKVLDFDGQMENRVEIPALRDQEVEDEMSARFICTSRKEKSQGFMQRSSNAIVGAADAVRRAATRNKGACIEDTRRTESIVLGGDGTIWSGCLNGLLVQWDGNGNRLREMKHHNAAVLCFCSSGDRIYVGYSSGYIQVLNLEGNLVASWVSHSSPVIKLAAGNDFVFSLAAHGGIRAWHVTSPGPMDDIIRSELSWKEPIYSRQNNIRILIGTWNVGEGRATYNSLKSWLGSVATDVGIVVVGLQEVEMGAGFLAVSAVKEIVGLQGSAAGNWWLDAIGKALDEKSSFEQIGSRQLGGLVISLWVRKNLRSHVGDIDVAAVPCGFARAFGNKGGVGLRIRVFDRTMCFVNCHLAAHLEAVNHRNADFDHIYRTMVFTKPSTLLGAMAGMVPRLIVACTLGFFIYLFWLLCSSGFPWALSLAAGVSIAVQMLKAMNNSNNFEYAKRKPDLAEADLVTFFGDLNYRLSGITYDEARDFISHRCFDGLKEKDQLRLEMKAGRVFQGMREPVIAFPPTYKFERHRPGLAGYDSGGQKRIPAWCDRVIYRDNQSSALTECSLACPVVASVLMYEACMDVTESDHKPVRCKFDVNIAHVDRSVRRQELGKIIRSKYQIRSMLNGLCNVPETTVSINSIVLQSHDTACLQITNKSANDTAVFKIVCEGQSCVKDDVEAFDYIPRGCFGFPQWLQVTPAAGIIKPGSSVEVSVHHEDIRAPEEIVDGIPRSWWCEDTRDKEALLAVTVEGSCSIERVSHRIKVRYCFSELDGLKKHVGGSRHHRF